MRFETRSSRRELRRSGSEKARTIRSIFDLGFSSDTARVVLPCATGSHEGVDRAAVTAHVAQLRDDLGVRIKELEETQQALSAFLDEA